MNEDETDDNPLTRGLVVKEVNRSHFPKTRVEVLAKSLRWESWLRNPRMDGGPESRRGEEVQG